MPEPISRFLISGAVNYLNEAAQYLEARGLAANTDVPIRTAIAVRTQYYLDERGTQPFVAEGWGYMIQDIYGNIKDNQYLMRVLNWPAEDVPIYKRAGVVSTDERGKFRQTSRQPVVHYCGGSPDAYYQADVVALHEKISSGTLMWKNLRVPSVAISGCTGWGSKGILHPELERTVRAMQRGATLAVHFDKDITANPNIYRSAGALMGAVGSIRPDIHVKFPALPEGPTPSWGWDDWWVAGATANDWLDRLAEDGVEVEEQLPLAWLRSEYGVSVTVTQRTEQLEQTTDNYCRLFNHPRWTDLRWDLTGDCYAGLMQIKRDFSTDYLRWVERTVCSGYGGKVSVGRLERAASGRVQDSTVDMVGEFLRARTARPTPEEWRNAATDVATLWPVHGCLQGEEYIQTLLRMARDMLAIWSGAGGPQWILSFVGPSGCGKTTAIERMMQPIVSMGLASAAIGQIPKIKQQMNQNELVRIVRDNRWALMDDLNHKTTETDARAAFNMLYTLSSGTETRQREMRQERAVVQQRHAVLVVTSVDREFIRTPKDTGERRFITLEVTGQSADGWAEAWTVLLSGAAWGLEIAGDATEFSRKYVGEYVRESLAHSRMSMATLQLNWETVQENMERWHRGSEGYPLTEPYRFSSTMLADALGLTDMRGVDLSELMTLATDCGAVRIGQGRVNYKGKSVMKDLTYGVQDVGLFIEALGSKL